MSYDYLESIKEDVKNYIDENREDLDFSDREDLEESLNDTLFNDDSVTGNASGSYTFNRYTAREYVLDNMDLLYDVVKEFGIESETVADKFLSEDYEYFDVSIRCYLLGSAISDVLDDLEESGAFNSEED